ncbi:bifunctional isocitrate dehydrogenase kinase/phosphatase [Aestuariibacter sp. A3R04]|uniref:bifunctional isocitrate dehydrogenase kinase/phosphatase n=1 Tax=Aestuariibacter sp. A3R04 TaxID=2841571 RepID=UPI001C0A52FF|nr:bifunctional isocitrate dehydrogenase kinase/phosphatase [Aestuariibacter sp. A3R04]MBU3021472.1 bifunctional isocitrate dehydrogenase kinase/phosphatase [Aestuariibacter sp. A3R04]
MTNTDLAKKIAFQILTHFDKSYRWFTRITRGAKARFENGEWQATQTASQSRIHIYEKCVSEAVSDIYQQCHINLRDPEFWREVKDAFTLLLQQHPQFELAETFYNSIIGRVFRHTTFDDNIMFLLPSRCFLAGRDREKVINSFDTTTTVAQMYETIFQIYRFKQPFENKSRDMANLEAALRRRLNTQQLASVCCAELLKPVFYRGKSAYLIGRICMPDETLPFVISIHTNEIQEIYVDALLTDPQDLSVIFGFARSYFMVDTQHPAEIAAFLQELLPNKKHFELYMSLGHHKHGKTVFYRNFLQHLDNSTDEFERAPGTKGLVMMVFHLPSYGVVFKIIRDEFAESKKITRDHVKACYKLVKLSDRVGRMADTHEYVNFHIPLARIAPSLLAELKASCGSSLTITNETLIIHHLYIERKMTPLNVYLQQEKDEEKIKNAIDELGLCIKQIALANIFPGDMLHKNFGITRHGRVIFYDYDEICLMKDRNFRSLPRSDDPYALDTLSVAPDDVFPEQFEHFILGKKQFKDILKALHGDLMRPEYWRSVQAITASGEIQNFTPYNPAMRFARTDEN